MVTCRNQCHCSCLQLKPELKEAHTLFYKPFADLEGNPGSRKLLRVMEVANVEQFIADGQWYDARIKSAELIQSALAGLRYLQT